MNTNHRTTTKSRLQRYLLPSITGRGLGVGLSRLILSPVKCVSSLLAPHTRFSIPFNELSYTTVILSDRPTGPINPATIPLSSEYLPFIA